MKKGAKPENLKSNRKFKLIAACLATISIVIVASILLYYNPNKPGEENEPKAAIIDQLSSSSNLYQNQTFVDKTKELLYTIFDHLDYYSDNATVENYRNLASKGYKLIIWRVHSALNQDSKYIAISTSETNSSSSPYYSYLDNGQLDLCNITDDPKFYFGITPKFIHELMVGRFEDTVIILLSCNGLKEEYYATAKAFEAKGAKVVISWTGWIASDKNDNAGALLLDCLIDKEYTVGGAVDKIEPYSDPRYGFSELDYYPHSSEVESYTIPNYKQDANSNGLMFLLVVVSGKKPKSRFHYVG